MALKNGLDTQSQAFIKSLLQDTKPVVANEADIIAQDPGFSFKSKDSLFKFDPISAPLKNTQQLKVDWAKFENHTFFSSAEVKVNEAFDIIINKFPFDGSKSEVDEFVGNLTGFEKWVFDQFPSWSGALHFSGTQVGEDTNGSLGTWISVADVSGKLFPEISKNSEGKNIISSDTTGSLSIEALLFLPEKTNDTQVVFQKIASSDNGFTFYLSGSTSTSFVTASFCVSSGSSRTSVSAVLNKGIYNHVCLVMNREILSPSVQLQFYNNEVLKASSDDSIEIGIFSNEDSSLLIGTGSSFYSKNTLVTPTQTLSGSLDEFRVFHSVRDIEKQKLYAAKGIYSTPDLKLYYRFNEPDLSTSSESDSVSSIVLDSSGNSLHANISNYTGSLRKITSSDPLNPVRNEKKEFSIVLFPQYEDTKNLNSSLLSSASLYDLENPNFIAKLVPRHYFLEAAYDEGYKNQYGNAGNSYGGIGIPGQGEMGTTHLMLSFLYIWAKFFDDIKMYIDAFGNLRTVGYGTEDVAPDNFLLDIIKSNGFYLPAFFNHNNLNSYVDDSDGPESEYSTGLSFKSVNAQILRRVITNLGDITRSKGTQHSIRSFLRSVGIDPDNSLKIREYGGPTTKFLGSSRNKKLEPMPVVDFVSSSLIISSPLSGSRIEPGYPKISGNFVKNALNQVIGTSDASDGLLTSGSWTVECHYKFPEYKSQLANEQSLIRMFVTGSNAASNPGLVVNVVAVQKTITESSKLKAYVRPGADASSPTLIMTLNIPEKGIFDGERWNVSFGRKRDDELGSNFLSSSYFLRAGKSNAGEIQELYTTSEFFKETNSTESNVFEKITSSFNASGSYISIGSCQTFPESIIYPFLNNTAENSEEARLTDFYGWASHLKFWSKFIDESEWREHVRNFKSSGVSNPKINWNFVTSESGSFNRLRIDTLVKQSTRTASSLGEIDFINQAYNDIILRGTNFGSGSTVVLTGDVAIYSYLSPEFDESSTDEKIRIRGLSDIVNIDENVYAVAGPAYASNESFVQSEPIDDTRLSIEFSLSDALDRDIINMFSSFDALSDAIGRPEVMFGIDYPDLEILRDVYFNRLTENLNIRKFFEFYRWFDLSISTFIEQLVPGKTRFKGTNFVIESHILERHKRESRHIENYYGSKFNLPVSANKLLINNLDVIIKKI